MVFVVDELVDEVKLEPEIPQKAKDACAERDSAGRREPWAIWNLVFLDLDVPVGAEHSAPDNEEVECHSEGPFLGGPLYAKYCVEDLEDVGHDEGIVHEEGNECGADQKLRKQEGGSIVELMTKRHRHVNDDVPPRYEGCEIIERVVAVHGIRKDYREEIEANEDHGDSVEAEFAFLVI